jgi:uncharacterized iron-regulated protein
MRFSLSHFIRKLKKINHLDPFLKNSKKVKNSLKLVNNTKKDSESKASKFVNFDVKNGKIDAANLYRFIIGIRLRHQTSSFEFD